MKARKHVVELSDKELYLLWTIACHFRAPVTSALKAKLSGLADSPLRHKFDAKYEELIGDRIIDYGKWLAEYRKSGKE